MLLLPATRSVSTDNRSISISLLSTNLQSIHRTLLAWRCVHTSAKAWYGCTLFWYLAPAGMISQCSDLGFLGNTVNKQTTIPKVRPTVHFPTKTAPLRSSGFQLKMLLRVIFFFLGLNAKRLFQYCAKVIQTKSDEIREFRGFRRKWTKFRLEKN